MCGLLIVDYVTFEAWLEYDRWFL